MSCVLSLCLLVASGFPPQGGTAALEILPLQNLCSPLTGLTPPPWGTMLVYSNECRLDLLGSSGQEVPLPIDLAVNLLRTLHPTELENSRLRIDTAGDTLLVVGDGPTVALVHEQVREISAILTRPLQVEVAVWDAAGREAPPAIMAPREWSQFVAGRSPLWRSLADTSSARPVALDRQRWTTYVRDVSVEVAQKQTIGQPETNAFGEGGRVIVTPHALVGGDDLVLHVQFGTAQRRGPVRSTTTGVPGLADIELPLLETEYGAFSGRVTNGGALAVTMQGHAASGGQFVMTVRISSRTPPGAQAPAGLGIFPCSALTSIALTQRQSPPSAYPRLGDEVGQQAPNSDQLPGFGYLPADQFVDLVRSSLGAAADEGFAIEASGGYLFVRSNEALLAKVDAMVRALQDRMLQTVTVRHEAQLVPADLDPAAAPPTSRTLLHTIVFPTLLGREATMARILETNVLRDLYPEIAQEASILDPIVTTLQVGSWLRFRAAPQGPTCHVQMLAQCTHAPPAQPRTVVPAGGILMPVELSSTRTAHDSAVTKGQPVEHGDGPLVSIDGRPFRSTLATVVLW